MKTGRILFVLGVILLALLVVSHTKADCYAEGDTICGDLGTLEYVCGNLWVWEAPEGSDVLIVETAYNLGVYQAVGGEDPEYINIEGDFVVMYIGSEPQAVKTNQGIECDSTRGIPLPDNRTTWLPQNAVIYPTETGGEIYCIVEGMGEYAIALDEETLSGTEFLCGTFYVLDTGEYQLSFSDGAVIVSDNIWFVGAYAP